MSEITEQSGESGLDGWDVLRFMQYPRNGIGASKLYADAYKDKLRFVPEIGMYYYYNGVVWVKDLSSVYALRMARKFWRDTIALSNKIEDETIRRDAIKFYNRYGDLGHREKLVRDAKTIYVVEFKEFDSHPDLYNCKNGTLDLKTGDFREHRSSDMLTQVSNVFYDENAKCERWDKFIDEVMEGDEQSKALLQMISGYCLSGSTKLECFFMLYGESTRNGKGTFNNVMFKMHNDYAKTLRTEALSAKSFYGNGDSPNESIASLNGARYVCVSEPGESLVLDSDLVKALTGGDPITARFLHQHNFTFFPQFKIVINTNFLPLIKDDTIFSSERLFVLNFTRHFDAANRDNDLKNKLVKDENMSGIFNWCYEGYKMLERSGTLKTPDKSKAIFNQYREDSDTTQQFINECLIASEGARTSFKKVYDRYRDWSRDSGFQACSKKTLEKRLRKKQFKITDYGNRLRIFNYEIIQNDVSFD